MARAVTAARAAAETREVEGVTAARPVLVLARAVTAARAATATGVRQVEGVTAARAFEWRLGML